MDELSSLRLSMDRSGTINIIKFIFFNSKFRIQNSKLCLNGLFVQTLIRLINNMIHEISESWIERISIEVSKKLGFGKTRFPFTP